MYKNIILIIFFIGILFVTLTSSNAYVSSLKEQNKVEYRYIPRNFQDEQLEPVYVSEIFENMFKMPSPWISSISNYDQQKQETINQYFINQL